MSAPLRVLFFAQLREDLHCAELLMASEGIASVTDVQRTLLAMHPEWRESLLRPNILVAVNQIYARVTSPVVAGDEVAFFPPVTGG